MKKSWKIVLTVALAVVALAVILILVFALDAANAEKNNRVALRENVRWSSADPEFSFTVYEDCFGGFGEIRVGEEREEIYFAWGYDVFEMTKVGEYGFVDSDTEAIPDGETGGANQSGASDVAEISAGGKFERRDDDTVVLTFGYDSLFDGALIGAEAVMTAENIDSKAADPRDRSAVVWERADVSTKPVVWFFVGATERRRGTGELERDGWRLSIRFYFRENGRFEIFSLIRDRESETPILQGTYRAEENRLTLEIETDEVYGGAYPEIALVGN